MSKQRPTENFDTFWMSLCSRARSPLTRRFQFFVSLRLHENQRRSKVRDQNKGFYKLILSRPRSGIAALRIIFVNNAHLLHGGRVVHFVTLHDRCYFKLQRGSAWQLLFFLQHVVIFDAILDAKIPQFGGFVFFRYLHECAIRHSAIKQVKKQVNPVRTSNSKVKFSISIYFFKYRSQRLFKCSNMYLSPSLSRSNVSCGCTSVSSVTLISTALYSPPALVASIGWCKCTLRVL